MKNAPPRKGPIVAAKPVAKRLVVLVSGSGTNLQALLDEIAAVGPEGPPPLPPAEPPFPSAEPGPAVEPSPPDLGGVDEGRRSRSRSGGSRRLRSGIR